jgi:hypothetical protein
MRDPKWRLVFLAFSVLGICGCAMHHPSSVLDWPASRLYDEGLPYGFFSGVWHGGCAPFAIFIGGYQFLLSLFGFELHLERIGLPPDWESIHIYGTPNTGVGYWVGFVMPLGAYLKMWVDELHADARAERERRQALDAADKDNNKT